MFDTLKRPLPKRQIWRLLAVDLGVILVLILVPVRIGYNDFMQERRAVRAQELLQDASLAKMARAQKAANDRPQMIGEIQAAGDVLRERTRQMRRPEDWPLMLQELSELIDATRVTLSALNPAFLEQQEGFFLRKVNVRAEGTYAEIVRLLHRLRDFHTLYLVEGFSLRMVADSGRPPQLTLQADLRTVMVEEQIPIEAILESLPGMDAPADTTGIAGDDATGGTW